jgi:hypothetical protein
MLTFLFGMAVGSIVSFIIVGLIIGASKGDHDQEVYQAYIDGLEAGQRAMQRREGLEMVGRAWEKDIKGGCRPLQYRSIDACQGMKVKGGLE